MITAIRSLIAAAAVCCIGICSAAGLPGWAMFAAAAAGCAFMTFFNLKPTFRKYISKRVKLIRSGDELLLVFCISLLAGTVFHLLLFTVIDASIKAAVGSLIFMAVWEFITFWNGIIRVYVSSVQLGIKWRVVGLICGCIPLVNLIVLVKIIRITMEECSFEQERAELDAVRAEDVVCKTKYPILMVHGVFFRDLAFFNYWGRIPAALKKNGAQIYYGDQESAAKVEVCAAQLTERIKKILEETGCEKVNIIAHSKGGLDSRYAISRLGADKMVATLTTVNTPHRGCVFAEYLLEHVPEKVKNAIADRYNSILRRLGDKQPDFLGAVGDLTAKRCKQLNEIMPDSPLVSYRSVGSLMPEAKGGKFPLNYSYRLAKYFDGDNDGLVSEQSMKWGESFTLLNGDGKLKRGISHGDIIDLDRENIKDFDIREFYVELVHQLKEQGY